ncbi:MAG: hypothetical protein AVDCRST_MAG56-5488 [uncultured Cytophagales bacterium]|uniref:Uncharacterized protein n=1 Tax=uncultured Cytophagales bacterium TaxID=158755 RepID=A0A6J4KAD5_9SPHI|nr:MAG: hypothetical protein AVDCRST_MAG56-5488 [uncultured Cytophagales bacterium]
MQSGRSTLREKVKFFLKIVIHYQKPRQIIPAGRRLPGKAPLFARQARFGARVAGDWGDGNGPDRAALKK